VCQAANERYLQALALVPVPQPAKTVLDPVSRRVIKEGRPYRALRPISQEEAKMFRILLNGAYRIQGFRNPDVRRQLYPEAESDPIARHKASGRITRHFRLLRAHGLIQKISGVRYYRVTDRGTQVMTTAQTLRETDLVLLVA
jgi:hypothetical protein